MIMCTWEQLVQLYPALTRADLILNGGTIALQDDGQGPYIKTWTNLAYSEPTQDQINALQKS